MTELSKIDSTTQEIIDEFAFFDDWMQRYEYIIEMGKALGLPDDEKTTPTRYRAASRRCGSTLARKRSNTVRRGPDAMIVRGLLRFCCVCIPTARRTKSLARRRSSLRRLNSARTDGSRANGLHAMVTRIHAYANAFRDRLSANTMSRRHSLMKRRSFTWKDGIWVEGNQPMLGPMSHAWWMASSVFDGARSFQQLAPDLDRHCCLVESGKAFHSNALSRRMK